MMSLYYLKLSLHFDVCLQEFQAIIHRSFAGKIVHKGPELLRFGLIYNYQV